MKSILTFGKYKNKHIQEVTSQRQTIYCLVM